MIDVLKSIDKKVDVIKNFYSINLNPTRKEIKLQGYFSDELEELIQDNIPGVHFEDKVISHRKVWKEAEVFFEGVDLTITLTY